MGEALQEKLESIFIMGALEDYTKAIIKHQQTLKHMPRLSE
jgi:hypothetical protein